MKRSTVRGVMTHDVVTVGPDTSFTTIARLLTERRINAVPVVDATGAVVGVVSMGDLVQKEVHKDDPEDVIAIRHRTRVARAKAAGCKAGELMTAPAIVISPDATVVDAARTMDRRGVEQLPVVDAGGHGHLVGIVTRSDLVRAFLRPDDDIREDVEAELRAVETPWATVTGIRVEVVEGIVTLTGRVERKSTVETAVRRANRIDGVVAVRNQVGYSFDDTIPVYPTF